MGGDGRRWQVMGGAPAGDDVARGSMTACAPVTTWAAASADWTTAASADWAEAASADWAEAASVDWTTAASADWAEVKWTSAAGSGRCMRISASRALSTRAGRAHAWAKTRASASLEAHLTGCGAFATRAMRPIPARTSGFLSTRWGGRRGEHLHAGSCRGQIRARGT